MAGLHKMLEGYMVADIVATFGSINMIAGNWTAEFREAQKPALLTTRAARSIIKAGLEASLQRGKEAMITSNQNVNRDHAPRQAALSPLSWKSCGYTAEPAYPRVNWTVWPRKKRGNRGPRRHSRIPWPIRGPVHIHTIRWFTESPGHNSEGRGHRRARFRGFVSRLFR